MYENMDVFLMVDKMDLRHLVDDALINRAIPFVVIRNKKVIKRLVNKMKRGNDTVVEPTEIVLTLSYPYDGYIN